MGKLLSKRQARRLTRAILLILLGLLVHYSQQLGWLEPAMQAAEQQQPGLYRVESVADGDTIIVDMHGRSETVRLIGVDTPETKDPRKNVQCYGQAAADFTRSLATGRNVRLEADATNTNRDRYQRLLRYVYLPDGRLLNAEIIRQGYGFAYTAFPFQKMDEFVAYQKEAEAANRGLWGRCSVQRDTGGQQTNDEP